jgi:hypothetical protein
VERVLVKIIDTYCSACAEPEHDTCSLTPGCPCCDDTIAAAREALGA